MSVKVQRGGRPLDGSKLWSYFSLFVDQSTPTDVRILLKETLEFAARCFLINDVDILLQYSLMIFAIKLQISNSVRFLALNF